ncbi:MAG: FliO/MopB family protein [SAR324 cluster bacterium]|nr:FliO/MopB family protein [SAR324 cluster bacterium]
MQACLLKIITWSLAVLFSLVGTLAFAQTELSNTFRDVKVSSSEQFERIELSFEKPFTSSHNFDFEQGLIFLRLPSVSMQTSVRQFDFPKSKLIRTIRARKNANSTSLVIVFRSKNLSLRRSLNVKIVEERLLVDLNRQMIEVVPEEQVAESDISREIQKRVNESESLSAPSTEEPIALIDLADEAPTLVSMPEEDWLMTLLTLILSLFLIFSILFLFLYLYKKILSGRFAPIQGKFKIQMVSTFHISPRQKVIVLEVNDQYFACGVTANNISFLTEVRDKQDQSFLENITLKDDEIELSADHSRAEFLKTLENARQKAQKIEEVRVQKEAPPSAESLKKPLSRQNGPSSEKSSKASFEKTLHQETSKDNKPDKATARESEAQRAIPGKKFNTPVPPQKEVSVLKADFKTDASMQDFAKKLGKKLKALKPIE